MQPVLNVLSTWSSAAFFVVQMKSRLVFVCFLQFFFRRLPVVSWMARQMLIIIRYWFRKVKNKVRSLFWQRTHSVNSLVFSTIDPWVHLHVFIAPFWNFWNEQSCNEIRFEWLQSHRQWKLSRIRLTSSLIFITSSLVISTLSSIFSALSLIFTEAACPRV